MFTLTFWFWRLATFGNDRPRGRAGAGRIFWGPQLINTQKPFIVIFLLKARVKNTKKAGFAKTTQKDQIQNLEAQVVDLRALERN